MLRQLYPILLSVTIALAIGVYLQPGEARKWIQQASQWGAQVLSDTLHATSALADETRTSVSQPGYASTNPAANRANGPYPSTPQDPTWSYVADGGGPATTLGAPGSPPVHYQPPTTASSYATPPASANRGVYPRVLANGSSSGQPRYQGQPSSPYPGGGGIPPAANGVSPYAATEDNPLRPSMPREAPWSTESGAPNTALPTTPPAPTYQEAQPRPRVGAAYPRVQWAGDWRDYRGVPEMVKPTDQSQRGYLPPPNVDSTVATVDRYLPSQFAAQTSAAQAMQPLHSGSSVGAPNVPGYQYPPTGAIGKSPGQQAQLPVPTQSATGGPTQNQGRALPPTQSGTRPAAPYQAAPYAAATSTIPANSQGQTSSSSGSIRVVPATPFGALTERAPQTPQPTNPRVASVPQRSALPSVMPRSPTMGTAIPAGAHMESPDPVADLTLCEGAQILARVGSELVLGCEVLPVANETLSNVEGIEEAEESDIAKAREQLVRQILPQNIEMKLLYVDAKRNLPPEAIENINQQLGKRFEEVEVSERLKKLELSSRRKLEEQLMKWGTSLEHEKRAFIEKAIAQQWVFEKLRKDEQITHEELLDYYQAHATKYDHPTRVRWEHLEVTFERHPNKREAWQFVAAMGNAVQQGRPFAQVAKERSEGVMASNGGQRDWLTQDSLKSEVLDRSLFSLPAGTMSSILEDETGLHIVRVVEREDAFRTPFEEIQGEIREELKEEHKQARLKEFIERLREEIPVWTVFDRQTADSGVAGANGGRRF